MKEKAQDTGRPRRGQKAARRSHADEAWPETGTREAAVALRPLTEAERDDVAQAIKVLRGGGVILYPTDTVWGLGCDARCSEAVKRIYEIKRRADSKALILLAADVNMVDRHVAELPDLAVDLVELTDKPLTIIYDGARDVAPELVAADGSIAMRVPLDNFCIQLCRQLRNPLVSTSANISGEPTPATFHQIAPEIIEAVDYVCTTRRDDDTPHTPSGIIKLSASNQVTIIR